MSSLSVHGKHVRNPTTWSRLGSIDFSAKIFTVRMDWVKLVWIIFWKTVVNTSRRNLKMWISRRRRRRWVLYVNDCGSNKEFREFGGRVHQHYQFRRVNDPDFCWTFYIRYKQSLKERCILNDHNMEQLEWSLPNWCLVVGPARHINPSEIRRGDVEANEPVDLLKT